LGWDFSWSKWVITQFIYYSIQTMRKKADLGNEKPGWLLPSGAFCIQESGSSVHLVELTQSGQNRLEVVEVEPGADLEVRDFPSAHPFVDGAGTYGQPLAR
jgi:hypothetical protein